MTGALDKAIGYPPDRKPAQKNGPVPLCLVLFTRLERFQQHISHRKLSGRQNLTCAQGRSQRCALSSAMTSMPGPLFAQGACLELSCIAAPI